MTAAQPDLFGRPPRRRPRVMMHVVDAGHSDGRNGFAGPCVELECAQCGHNTGWVPSGPVWKEKRGRPCPNCNDRKEEPDGHTH